jgi:competence protein ComEC
MKSSLLIFFLLSLSSKFTASEQNLQSQFIIWNVGQGQWTTLSQENICIHFDFGGESLPLSKLRSLCYRKKNILLLSHWDLDHLSGIAKIKHWPDVCLRSSPDGSMISNYKKNLMLGVRNCNANGPSQNLGLTEKFLLDTDSSILFSPARQGSSHTPQKRANKQRSSNDLSLVYATGSVLIPGDSTHQQEEIWSKNSRLKNIHGLVLGHHGSRTSTSEVLMNRLPNLKWAVASARWVRYKHPHPEVTNRLRKHKVPLLLTEDWGHLRFIK